MEIMKWLKDVCPWMWRLIRELLGLLKWIF